MNRFRVKTLGLEPVSTLWAPGQLYRQKVPFTYLWSPSLVPKPSDWGPEVDIAGFVFLDLAASFNPPKSLVRFLEAGPPPIYIGFGSIVVDDPDRFTAIIFEAVAKAGVRALVSKGWGGLGGGDVPEGIYMLGNTPHDWIFPKVSAIIHHGGAGTSAIGLKLGKPTMIVPFFGDQPFWGSMIAKAGAGYHEPVPYKALTVEKLVDGIRECLLPEAQANAKKLAECIAAEGDGAENAVESFHRSLPLRGAHCMRCSILDDRVAVWNVKKTSLKLSALAASMLVEQRRTSWHHLRLLRVYEWNDFAGPGEPISGAGAAIIGSVSGIAKGIGAVPVKVVKSIRRHEQRQAGKRSKSPQSSAVESGEKKPLSNGNGHRHLDKANGQTNGNGPHKSNGLARSDNLSGNADDEEEEENVARDAAKEAGKSLQESGKVLVKGKPPSQAAICCSTLSFRCIRYLLCNLCALAVYIDSSVIATLTIRCQACLRFPCFVVHYRRRYLLGLTLDMPQRPWICLLRLLRAFTMRLDSMATLRYGDLHESKAFILACVPPGKSSSTVFMTESQASLSSHMSAYERMVPLGSSRALAKA